MLVYDLKIGLDVAEWPLLMLYDIIMVSTCTFFWIKHCHTSVNVKFMYFSFQSDSGEH